MQCWDSKMPNVYYNMFAEFVKSASGDAKHKLLGCGHQ
jgi:hypothetical protein